jgi:hypothetical protein
MFIQAYFRREADLTLIQRMRRTTDAANATLPNGFHAAITILQRIAPGLPPGFT